MQMGNELNKEHFYAKSSSHSLYLKTISSYSSSSKIVFPSN